MYRIISFILIGVIYLFSRRHSDTALSKELNIFLNSGNSFVQTGQAVQKWPPVLAADAQNLARQQGDTWKKALKEKNILMGLGANGPDKLKDLLNSSDSTTKYLHAQLIKAADLCLTMPLPVYKDPAQAVSGGQTAAVAGTQQWMRPWGDQMVLLSVAIRIADNPAYRQRLHDIVTIVCRFPSWGASPLNADLAAAHVSRGIAMAWNWNPDLWTTDDRKLILDSIKAKVSMLSSAIYGTGKVWWAGAYDLNINQISAAGAGFCGLAFLNDIPEAKEWLAASWLNYKEVANRSNADGSGTEGASYWTYGLSFILQYIEATNDVLPSRSLYDSPFLKNAASYRINNSTPGFDGLISWGDSDPHDFAGPEHYLLRLSAQYKDGQARYISSKIHPSLGGGDDVKVWAWLWSQPSVPEEAPAQLDYFASSSDLINSRSGWNEDDYVLSLKSGFTNRSHSHLDAGSFALIMGSDWLIPMPKYGKGKSNGDFWDSNGGRWQYQSNSTESNSTLIVNKGQQRFDGNARGTIDHYASYDNAMTAECDLANVYNGANAVRRKIFHRRGEYIIVQDAVDLKDQGDIEWLLQAPPNAVTDKNTVSIAGRSGSVNIRLLSPQSDLTIREPTSLKRDMSEIRNTLSASVSGKNAGFIAAIEPKINGRETVERTYAVTSDGAVEIKTADTEERLLFAGTSSELIDKKTAASATAGFMYVKTKQDKLSEIILTDATSFSAGALKLSSPTGFSGDIVSKDGKTWLLTISSGKNIAVINGLKSFKTDGDKKIPVRGPLDGPGNYIVQ
jgi:hypothetical protein